MPSVVRTALLTLIAMLAFAGNSLLCRLALKSHSIDAASFTSIRLCSGAMLLYLLVRMQSTDAEKEGNWLSAFALFAYAAGFSFAYIALPASTGALLLFGAVQITMISVGLYRGERLHRWQLIGFVLACFGLAWLLLPSAETPSLIEAILMLVAGIAWGVYSLRGKSSRKPLIATAGNFLRAVPFSLALSLLMWTQHTASPQGIFLAICSGALASGLGYAIWYSVLPALKSTQAASVQLCVPLLATLGGVVFLGEPFSSRILLASVVILGGVALVIFTKAKVTQR